jgi:hypothetical protein
MLKITIEEAVRIIEESSAVIASAMCDTAISNTAQDGVARLASESENFAFRIRRTLPTSSLLLELIDPTDGIDAA